MASTDDTIELSTDDLVSEIVDILKQLVDEPVDGIWLHENIIEVVSGTWYDFVMSLEESGGYKIGHNLSTLVDNELFSYFNRSSGTEATVLKSGRVVYTSYVHTFVHTPVAEIYYTNKIHHTVSSVSDLILARLYAKFIRDTTRLNRGHLVTVAKVSVSPTVHLLEGYCVTVDDVDRINKDLSIVFGNGWHSCGDTVSDKITYVRPDQIVVTLYPYACSTDTSVTCLTVTFSDIPKVHHKNDTSIIQDHFAQLPQTDKEMTLDSTTQSVSAKSCAAVPSPSKEDVKKMWYVKVLKNAFLFAEAQIVIADIRKLVHKQIIVLHGQKLSGFEISPNEKDLLMTLVRILKDYDTELVKADDDDSLPINVHSQIIVATQNKIITALFEWML